MRSRTARHSEVVGGNSIYMVDAPRVSAFRSAAYNTEAYFLDVIGMAIICLVIIGFVVIESTTQLLSLMSSMLLDVHAQTFVLGA